MQFINFIIFAKKYKMKKTIVTMFLLAVTVSLFAQKPVSGTVMGERVPLYCGSTGSSSADSTRLPIIFQAKLMGLTPGASYKYYVRFITLSDTSSSSTTGAGIPLVMKKNGSWYTISSPDLSTSGGHDTLVLGAGMGEYSGWFGGIYTSDSRFTPGNYIYPMVVFEEISAGATTNKVYLLDSIKVLAFSGASGSNNGTAIYGSSFTKSKSAVVLYDDVNGHPARPIAATISENDGVSVSNMPSWYNTKVNGTNGAWGAIIPNSLSNGIKRIESRDIFFDSTIYGNMESDGIWGSDSTMNRFGGAKKPVFIKSDYAPLLKPEFEFVSNTTNLTESTTVVNMLVRRRYGNADTSKVSAFVTAGTATNNTDYNILTSFPLRFRPYGEVTDTIKVRVNDDFASEPTENAAIRLNNPVNGKIGFQTTHSINITDNDIPSVTFDKKSITVKENAGIVKVKLRINSGSSSPTSVKVIVKQKTDSTFIPSDFKLGSSNTDTTVQFGGGKIVDSLEFNIALVNDPNSEDRSDTVILALRNLTSPAKTGADSLLTLIIEDDDAPPIYRFSKSGMTVSENVGSIKIRIDQIGGNVNPSDIVLTYDPDSKNAQPGTDFTFSTQLIQFLNTDPDSVVYTIPIINDAFSEPREDAVFIIRASFNAKMGKPDTLRVTIVDNDLPEYKINKVITAKAPALVLDSLNVRCALRGIVHGVNLGPTGGNPGLTFTLIDNTGGIQVYQAAGTKGYTVTEGDSIQVYGKITQVSGMAQISQLDTIVKLGSGKPLKTAVVNPVLNESTESNMVKYNLVKLARPSQWPSTALSANTTATVKVLTQSDSFDLVIDSETDIDGKPAPTGFLNITGIGGQNDNSSPFNSGYFLAPRRFSDIQTLTVPVFGFTTDTSIGVEKRDSTEGFVLQCANLTSNQQINLVIKGGTAGRNVDYQSNANRLFILYPSSPSITVKSKLNDDALVEGVTPETIIWVIRDNAWGTMIGPDSIHVVKIIDDESVGIELLELSAKTKVYPNPAVMNSEVFVSSPVIMNAISITDVNGKVVSTLNNIHTDETVIATEGFARGIYTISIMTDKGKIVKQLSVY